MTALVVPQLALHEKFALTDLSTASETTLCSVAAGKNTIIDFWTTKCVRCPDALDKMNKIAEEIGTENVQFLSVVCGDQDGARNIIEKPDESPRWGSINHFYASNEVKEAAKAALEFKQVPFYVVLNEKGEIVKKGGGKDVDIQKESEGLLGMENKENMAPPKQFTTTSTKQVKVAQPLASRAFSLDEDF
jgi:thiol-disulfide isomerase/thioredoxin